MDKLSWKRWGWLRSSILGGVVAFIFGLARTYANKAQPDPLVMAGDVVLGLITGAMADFLIGAFDLLGHYRKDVAALQQTVSQLEAATIINEMIPPTSRSDPVLSRFLFGMIRLAIEYLFVITVRNRDEYYKLLQAGLSYPIQRWDAIHDNPIDELISRRDTEQSFNYFEKLKALPEHVKPRRILLLSQKDLERLDVGLISKVIDSSGRNVRTFVVYKPNLERYFSGRTLKLFDCALYDGHLLLHYDHEEHLIVFSFHTPTDRLKDYAKDHLFREVTSIFALLDSFQKEGKGGVEFIDLAKLANAQEIEAFRGRIISDQATGPRGSSTKPPTPKGRSPKGNSARGGRKGK